MIITNECAIDLGKLIAQATRRLDSGYDVNAPAARGGAISVFSQLADSIESPEARIHFCRAFRAEIDREED